MRRPVGKRAFHGLDVLEALPPQFEHALGVRTDSVDDLPVVAVLIEKPRAMPGLTGSLAHNPVRIRAECRPHRLLGAHAADARAQILARPAGREPRTQKLVVLRPLADVKAVSLPVRYALKPDIAPESRRIAPRRVEIEDVGAIHRTANDKAPLTAVTLFRTLHEPAEGSEPPESRPMPHRFLHIVALHRIDRDSHRDKAPHTRLGPTLLLVVEKKRHERLKGERTVEDRTRKKKILQHRVVIPKTSKEFFAVFRRQYLFYLLLGADFNEPIFQNRTPHV